MKNNIVNFFKKFCFIFLPFSYIYYGLHLIKFYFTKPYRSKNKVICVGNISMGGTGKTPICIYINELLKKNNIKSVFMLRGYGKNIFDVVVANGNCGFDEIGDEAMIYQTISNTYVCKNRVKSLKKIKNFENNSTIVISDDGFQNNSFEKDFSICVVDGEKYFGNGFVFPAGNLREPISNLKNFDCVVVNGGVNIDLIKKYNKNVFVTKINITYTKKIISDVILVSGIGNNDKFYNSFVKNNKVNVIKHFKYPDHYSYSNDDIINILNFAAKNNCDIVTTRKDYVKIPNNYKQKFVVQDIKIDIKNNDLLFEIINEKIC